MSNPNLGLYELRALLQMSDDAFEEYLESAVILNLRSQAPLPPNILRALLTLLREVGGDEEKHLKEMQDKGLDTANHLAFSIRALAHFYTIASWPVGAWESWRKHGIPHRINPHTGNWEPTI
jgi:hypothetical protein